MLHRRNRPIAFLGDYPPRKCGIATFTYDVANSVANAIGDKSRIYVIAVNDRPEGYYYPEEVKFNIREQIVSDYEQAADFVNSSKVGVLCVQHEYGIYGGRWGEYLNVFLRKVRIPVVTVLHTVLEKPKDDLHESVSYELFKRSDRLVVMSNKAVDIISHNNKVPRKKIHMIPHGTPDFPFTNNEKYKEGLDLSGKTVILTFGLLRQNKGIHHMVEAMAKLAPKHPDLVYVVLGVTHPAVVKREGEEYRHKLMRMVEKYGLQRNVVFHDRFVDLDELCEYINASDFYAIPYLIREQIVSGTLCYAVSAGKAVVSTPIWCAEEMLAKGRGVIVPFNSPDGFARSIDKLMRDRRAFNLVRKKAYEYGRNMIWPNVAKEYLKVFDALQKERLSIVSERKRGKEPILSAIEFPEPKLDHVIAMTDDFGIVKNAYYIIPRYDYGYSVEDNARAVVVASKFYRLTGDPKALVLLRKYLAFVFYAQKENGLFRNFFTVSKEPKELEVNDICQGRALWGLGYVMGYGPKYLAGIVRSSFDKVLPYIQTFGIKATAYSMLGMYYYLVLFSEDAKIRDKLRTSADKLVRSFEEKAVKKWCWFEDEIGWGGGVLPAAMWVAYYTLKDVKYRDVAKSSTDFLIEKSFKQERLSTLESDKRFRMATKDAEDYVPNPIDALWMVELGKFAYRMMKDDTYLKLMRQSFDWFLGYNDREIALYDQITGGCYDGLNQAEKNLNQGAESTLCAVLALLSITEMAHRQTVDNENKEDGR